MFSTLSVGEQKYTNLCQMDGYVGAFLCFKDFKLIRNGCLLCFVFITGFTYDHRNAGQRRTERIHKRGSLERYHLALHRDNF